MSVRVEKLTTTTRVIQVPLTWRYDSASVVRGGGEEGVLPKLGGAAQSINWDVQSEPDKL